MSSRGGHRDLEKKILHLFLPQSRGLLSTLHSRDCGSFQWNLNMPPPFQSLAFLRVVLWNRLFCQKKWAQFLGVPNDLASQNSSQNLLRIPNFQNLLTILSFSFTNSRYDLSSEPFFAFFAQQVGKKPKTGLAWMLILAWIRWNLKWSKDSENLVFRSDSESYLAS